MGEFAGQVAFITGGASGIGLAVAQALGEAGATLVLCDIEAATLDEAAATLRATGATVETEVLDVSDLEAYKRVAEAVLSRHATVHILFNNAGVGSHSPAGATAPVDWHWIMDVNVLGVVYGVELFLPTMRESGAHCHIINTASIAGHIAAPGMGAYCASKFAVVGYSECLRQELAESNVAVSVLCPAWVKTRIAESRRNHPLAEVDGEDPVGFGMVGQIIEAQGIDVATVAERVLEGLRRDTFYLFTHPDFLPFVDERLERIRSDYSLIAG